MFDVQQHVLADRGVDQVRPALRLRLLDRWFQVTGQRRQVPGKLSAFGDDVDRSFQGTALLMAKHQHQAFTVTGTGVVVGTPSYMAPEQAEGKNDRVGPATDIYALGAILYQLLTGKPPFAGTSGAETLVRVATEEPASISRSRPGTPRDLETICLKCLRKLPGERYATALELAAELARRGGTISVLARRVGD